MATARPSSRCARFDKFEVDVAAGELRKSGERVTLQDQPFQILRLLIESAPEVVTREQISSVLWPSDTFVDFDLAINTAVRKLRQALGDPADNPKFIQTLAKRGYRFLTAVNWLDSKTSDPADRNHKSTSLDWRRFVLGALGLAVFTFAVWQIRQHWLGREPDLNAVPLTALPGSVSGASFSPDGQQIVFSWDRDKNWPSSELFAQMVGGSGQPLQLTHMPSFIGGVAWSPDGRSIAYDRIPYTSITKDNDLEIVMIPALPDHEDILARGHSGPMHGVSWSPDGRYLAFSDREQLQNPAAIFLVNKETRERRRLTTPPEGTAGDSNPTFSSDGKKMAFVRTLTDGMTQLVVLLLQSDKEMVLQSEDIEITGLTWDPQDKDIIYAANKTGISGLWRVSTGGGKSRALPLGEDAVSVAVSARSHRLTYTRASTNINIWQIRFGGPGDQHETRAKLIASSRQQVQPAVSPDGSRIAFISDRSGPQEIWICRSDGSDPLQLTHLGNRRTGTPRWSPDGSRIVFDSRRKGRGNIYTVSGDGGPAQQITNNKSDSSTPSWSASGKFIYYTVGTPFYRSNAQIWKVPVTGGQPQQVTQHGGEIPLEAPDGNTLYYVNPSNESEIWKKSLPAGEEQRVMDILSMSNSMSWEVTREGIYFTDSGFGNSLQQTGALRFFSFGNRKTTTLATLGTAKGPAFGISVRDNGRTILYSQTDHNASDLMLVENFH